MYCAFMWLECRFVYPSITTDPWGMCGTMVLGQLQFRWVMGISQLHYNLWDHLLMLSVIAWNVVTQYLTSLSLPPPPNIPHSLSLPDRLYSSYCDWQHNIPLSGHCHNFLHHSTCVGHWTCFQSACFCNCYGNGHLFLWDFFHLWAFSLEKILSVGW